MPQGSRDRYTQALHTLLLGGYRLDAAYLAERVLSPDELTTYLDRTRPLEERPEKQLVRDRRREAAEPLRYLAARRLARLGRYAEAERYLPATRRAGPSPDKRWHYGYFAADLAWEAVQLMPDQSDPLVQCLREAGTWLMARDPPAADRFYEALVIRCGKTELGKEAARLHWFPKRDR